MSAVLQFNYQMTTVECANCCITFAMAARFVSDRREDHKTFYCPQGHTNYFAGLSETERLKSVLAQKDRDLTWQRNRAERSEKRAEAAQRRLTAIRGVVTRTKNRIAKGKCPRCSEQFPNLAKHMADTHPEYAVDSMKTGG